MKSQINPRKNRVSAIGSRQVIKAIRQSNNHKVNPHFKIKAKLSNNDACRKYKPEKVHLGAPNEIIISYILRVTRKWDKTEVIVEQQKAADGFKDGNVLSGDTSSMRACGTQWTEGATSHKNLSCQIKFEINYFDNISISANT
jgi:hypothetical protein